MGRPLRVLVVEDVPDDADMMILALQSGGLDPAWERVESGEELAAALANGPWDAVLSDYTLPKFGALAALAAVRAADLDLPFLVVSGTVGEEVAVGTMRAGASDYVLKQNLTRLAPALDREIREAENRRARKQAVEAMRASETRYRRLFEAARDGVLIVDAGSRQILDANPFLTALLGYHREELVGKELWEIGLFRDAEANQAAFRTLQEQGYVRYDNQPLLTKDGQPIEVDFLSNIYDAGGARVIQCNIRDITARREAEAALQLRDRAIQAVTQGILITDPCQPDNPIIYASPGFCQLTGYQAAEVLGRNCRFLQGQGTDAAVVAQLRRAIKAGEPGTVELLNYRKDGTPFWNELSVSPVRDGAGRLTHFVGVQGDVTGRRQLEEQFRQAQKMEAFGQLAGGVAHDFNNLLTIISGYSEVMLASLRPDDRNRVLLGEIHKAGERAILLTRQLLAFSRKQVVQFQVLDLNGIVTNVERMLGRLIGEDVKLTTVLAPDLQRVKVDAGQIEQVIMNLVVNARDAMPQGGGITVETSNADLDDCQTLPAGVKPGRYVLLAVSDTGCGMTEVVKAHIFEPFFTTKEVGKGTGLGLATVFGIVKQCDGHIAVSSEPGHGTTFKIYLPVAEELLPSATSPSAVRPALQGTETILLTEDEPALRTLAHHVLEMHGYTVLEASEGEKALRLAEAYPGTIHLLVTDVVMPVWSGRQLAERLAAVRPGVKVLYISGYTDDAVVRHGVLQAEAAFLQKPFTPGALATKVREVHNKPGAVSPAPIYFTAQA